METYTVTEQIVLLFLLGVCLRILNTCMVPFFKLAMYATSIKNLVHRTIFLNLLNLSRDILVCVNERTPIINEEYLIHYSNPKSVIPGGTGTFGKEVLHNSRIQC